MSMAQGLKLEHENGWKSCYMTNTLMWVGPSGVETWEPSGAWGGGLGFTLRGGVLGSTLNWQAI